MAKMRWKVDLQLTNEEKRSRLVELCYELARLQKCNGLFFLSQRVAGTMVGVRSPTAAKWLRSFVGDGVLEVVVVASHGHATQYRYMAGAKMVKRSEREF